MSESEPGMNPSKSLYDRIRSTGFSCVQCGSCCREIEPGSNLVMVGPEEISSIMEGSGLSFEDIAEPFPDRISESGRDYTFGWVIRRSGNHCRFLDNDRCMIYENRPWICRTYPFMVDDNGLSAYACEGIGTVKDSEEALDLAFDLCKRREYERGQDDKIRNFLSSHVIPAGKPVVIDAEGIKEYHG